MVELDTGRRGEKAFLLEFWILDVDKEIFELKRFNFVRNVLYDSHFN